MRVTRRCLALLLAICPLSYLVAESLIPTTEGTTWNYEMVEEKPNDSLDLEEPTTKERFPVSYRIGGIEKIEGKALWRLEVYRGDALENVDLITVNEQGVVCSARMDQNGALIKFDPPQTMVATPLKKGTAWNFDGKIGERKVTQHYEIVGQEDVDLAAGKFHAWRIHCEQSQPNAAKIDRWFVPGTGFVRVVTQIDSSSGGLLQKTVLELKQPPKIATTVSDQKSAQAKLSVGLSPQPIGEFASTYKSDAPAICARWQGRNLRAGATVRAEWIAEKVDGVDPDDEIDEATAVVETANSHGVFTLSQPTGGWTPGNYRVDFYLDGKLAGTAKAKIVK